MENQKIKFVLLFYNFLLLVVALLFLFLNLKVVSVIHAKESEMLPVLKYETYSSLEVTLFYIFIILVIINLIFILIKRLEKVRLYFISFVPIVSLILIILIFTNPHSLIIKPTGFPPTRLENLYIGVLIGIILFVLISIEAFYILYLEKEFKKYIFSIGIIIGGLLLGDFIHESGHAIIVLLSGGEVNQFIPFPVLLGNEFNAGYVGFSNVPPDYIPLVYLGGEIFQWITIFLISVILYFKPKYRENLFILSLLFIALLDFPLYVINNSIGLPHWFFIGGVNGDITSFSELTGFPLWILIVLGVVQLFITALYFYILILKNRKKITKEDSTII